MLRVFLTMVLAMFVTGCNSDPDESKIHGNMEKPAKQAEEDEIEGAKMYSRAFKGRDEEFIKGVQQRIVARYLETSIEPLANFVLDTTSGTDIYANYLLKQTPLSLEDAQKETREVLLMMIGQLMAMGINPGKENIIVSLSLVEPDKGITGKQVRRLYGQMQYRPHSDSIQWVPAD